MLESKVLVNDCRFGVSPVIYPDPDPERKFNFCTINIFFFVFDYNRIIENVFVYLFIYLLTPGYNLLEFVSLFITFFMCLIISFTGIHGINTRNFLFHSDDDTYILETIKTLT